ncbi:hypothetical protein D9619_011651 [Psilocybe cf. subviscida]|uniref:CCHC-type domain-containing protein n=1 Tax=Psilocybe cf. subviscida TaxID=2480587 RepID=A0A8H5BUM5_9AGAR|nr:hypothetical protein D9619_011651 [Psilocybe cf. subviscida]
MTRVTNFGIKRTYVQAGFAEPDDTPQPSGSTRTSNSELTSGENGSASAESLSATPAKKKRKRTPKSKRDGHAAERAAEEARAKGEEPPAPTPAPVPENKTELSKRKEYKKKRNLERRIKVESATEARRLKRIQQKNSSTTCFACREKGHSAKDCKSVEAAEPGAAAVGVCYRCGSKKHSLSRCKKPADPSNPFPYASCFVCNGKGHLASACPLNKAKGVYPNGGSCKLCGETSHLAKDCGIRQKVTDSTAAVLGTGREAGADEDDFLLLKQKTIELDRNEKQASKQKEMLDIRMGTLTGTVKAVGAVAKPKKVVLFK